MSDHIKVTGERDWFALLVEVTELLGERFGIAHITLQPEEPHLLPEAFRGCSIDTPEERATHHSAHAGHHH